MAPLSSGTPRKPYSRQDVTGTERFPEGGIHFDELLVNELLFGARPPAPIPCSFGNQIGDKSVEALPCGDVPFPDGSHVENCLAHYALVESFPDSLGQRTPSFFDVDVGRS